MKFLFYFILFNFLNAGIFSIDITPIHKDSSTHLYVFNKIKILDQKQFVFKSINGVKFSETQISPIWLRIKNYLW